MWWRNILRIRKSKKLLEIKKKLSPSLLTVQCWQYLQGFESMQPLTGHQRPLNTSTSPYTSLQILLMFAGIEESWSLRLLCLWRQDSAQSTPLTPLFSESLKFFHSQCHVIFIIQQFSYNVTINLTVLWRAAPALNRSKSKNGSQRAG